MSAVLTPPSITPVVPTAPPDPPAVPIPRRTAAQLLHELGDIPAERVRVFPPPGTATEADAYWVNERDGVCELVNGTLVEKPMSVRAEYAGMILGWFLLNFVLPRRSGMVAGPKTYFRMPAGNLRLPDVSFTRGERLPDPLPTVGGWCPDLCVEVLSPGNTAAEMAEKRIEYFTGGCQLVWEIDPLTRTATVYSDPVSSVTLGEGGVLDGGQVLPGFALPLRELFAACDAVHPPQHPPTP